MDLGIDIGTSGVKAVLVDDDGRLVGSHTAPLTVSRPHDGWSEQDPADWISANDDALAALATAHPIEMSAVRSIGLSGQMHGATLLDATDHVLRPAILWNDVRSHAEAAVLDADAVVRDRSGNAVFPGFTAPKLAWVQANEPEIFDRVATVLLPKDHVRLWLTGEKATDASDASGTSWLDVGERAWSTELLERTHLTVDHMPTVVEGSAPTGQVRAELSERFGFASAPVIAGGGGDNAASAVSASSPPAPASSRSARRASCSLPPTRTHLAPRRPSTRSATPCPTRGTRCR